MGADFDFELPGVIGAERGFGRFWFGGGTGGEAQTLGREGEEDLFDGIEGAIGEDIDGIDDVVEESLLELVLVLEGSEVRI